MARWNQDADMRTSVSSGEEEEDRNDEPTWTQAGIGFEEPSCGFLRSIHLLRRGVFQIHSQPSVGGGREDIQNKASESQI